MWRFELVAILGGLAMLDYAVKVFRLRTGPEADRASKSLFGVSILYLFALFLEIVGERCVAIFIPSVLG